MEEINNEKNNNIIPKSTQPSIEELKQTAAINKRRRLFKRIVRLMWAIAGLGFAMVAILFIVLSYQLPSFEQLENPKIRVASEIYSSDGVLLGKYYIENRTPVPYDSISPHVINALISTEDARYYNHSGIDIRALMRVLVKTIIFQDSDAGGGSTISQQLAKLLVGRPDTKGLGKLSRGWVMLNTKLKEWLTAVKLERSYTKKEILTMYLNEFDFLYNAYGIQSAAETYFGKQPIDLDINESAMLVRMLKNPSMFNYKRDMKKALEGRAVVLNNMRVANHITQKEYDDLQAQPIDPTKFHIMDHNEGLATYFREYLREHLKEVLARKENLKANGKPFNLYEDGLKIYTTIDSRIQAHAEQAVLDHLSGHQAKLFKHWKHWNMANPSIGYKYYNPWTYKTHKNSNSEIELRLRGLYKMTWKSDRYKAIRSQYLKTAQKYQLRDVDIYRMLKVDKLNKKPKRNPKFPRKPINGEAILAKWKETGYATNKQIKTYKKILKSDEWATIRSEYDAIMKYMQKPVKMQVFSYLKKNDKWTTGLVDTLMSPFDSIKYHRMFLQAGSISVEPQTGYVRSWVGGIDHRVFKLDHVTMGGSVIHPSKRIAGKEYNVRGRQVGSSIKPFLYALNIDLRGYSPCYEVEDIKTTIEKGFGQFNLIKDWTPKNAGGGYSGRRITLTQALRMSLNSVSAQLMKDLNSTEKFRLFLYDVGIDTSKVPSSPTICLGTPDLTPFEMAGGYTIFANGGVYNEPIFIDRIEDHNNNPLYSAESDQIVMQVLNENGAYVMSEMLQAVQRGVPGFHGIKSTHGGKTGTTNFQSDGWFMGVTPNLIIGTWVGCDDRFIRFRTLLYGQGGHMARPIFQNTLRYLENDPAINFDTKARFPKPDNLDREMNCIKYAQFEGAGDDLTDQRGIYSEDWDEFSSVEDEQKPAPSPDENR